MIITDNIQVTDPVEFYMNTEVKCNNNRPLQLGLKNNL